MAQTQREFIEAVMDKLGLTQTELGVKLKKPNAYQSVHGWIEGKGKLGYIDTMKMLEFCGWLSLDGAPTLRLTATEQPATELAELRANQKRMLDDQQRVIESLESLTTSVEKLVRGIGDQPGEQQQQHE